MAVDNTILVRRGSGTPSYSDFTEYELAYDYSANKLYIRDGNEMVEIGGTGASTSGSNNQLLTDDGSGGINSESKLTFDNSFLELTDSQLRLDNSTFGTYNWEFRQDDGGDLLFKVPSTGGAELRISADGGTDSWKTTEVLIAGEINLHADGTSYFKQGATPLVLGGTSAYTTGGTPRLSIQGAGLNIGSGTNDMSYMRRIATGEYQWQTWNGANDGELHLQPYGGNVGIGTTNPQQKLQVDGNIYLGPNNSNNAIHSGANIALMADGEVKIVADANDTSGTGASDIVFGYGTSTNTDSNRDFTIAELGTHPRVEIMRIDASTNRVGIGTASPLGHLDINTEAAEATKVYINGEASQDKLLLIRHYGNSEAAGSNAYAGFVGSIVDNVLSLGHYTASGTELGVMHITEVGKVGIGQTSPTTALEVIGDIKIKQGAGYGNYSLIDATEAVLTLETYSVNTSNHSGDIIFKPAGTERMRIGDDGVVDISGSLILDTALAVAEGGTGATSAHNARINLGLGTLAELNQVTAATIADNNVGAAELNVSGNGSSGQVLASDGDGSFSWVAQSGGDITQVAITAGNGLTGSATTNSGNHSQTLTVDYLPATDDRDVKPNAITTSGRKQVRAYFTSLGGLTGTANSDYQDLLVLSTYSDGTGGDVNALAFDKSTQNIYHYLADQSATTWGTPKRIAYIENGSNNRVMTASSSSTVNGEGNLTFDGTDLSVAHSSGSVVFAASHAYDKIKLYGSSGHERIGTEGSTIVLTASNFKFRDYSTGATRFFVNSSGSITTGTWQGTAIANAYIANLPASKITSGELATARVNWDSTDKTVRWDNGRGYHGNPRSMAIGYSGGNYGQFGYNIDFTTTSGQHTAAFTDIATRVDMHDGLRVYSSVSNATGGSNISWTEYLRCQNSVFSYKGNTIWHAGNDGGGSGLDADKVDGLQSSQLFRNDATSGTITSQNWNDYINGTEVHFSSVTNHSGSNRPTGAYHYGVALSYSVNSGGKFQLYAPETASAGTATNQGLWYRSGWNTTYRPWVQIWDSGNDGSGSGLNADLVDGLHASSFLRSDANDTATGTLTLANQTWNGHITWNSGKNVYVGGESSFDVSGSGVWQVWDSGTGAPFIKCDVGQRVEIGQAGSRGLKVHGDFDPTGTHYVRHGGSDYSPNISFLGGSNVAGSNAYENAGIGYYDNSGTGSMKFFGNRSTMSWFFTDSDETLFSMASDGTFHAEADVVAYSQNTNSDRRLKEDINPIQYGLKEVLEINPVKYKWIEKRGGKEDIGVIAQDIEKIIPEIVQENKALNSDEMIKSVDYGKMVAVLIKAVQEQQEQINELKEKLNG
tara:strand:- start:97 stop:4104 length:4008 start_codon:yes stop_codon:yes gene_type:complete